MTLSRATGPRRRLVPLSPLLVAIVALAAAGCQKGYGAYVRPDGALALDAMVDAGTDATGLDAGPDADTRVCGGDCDNRARTACSCDVADPCGWQADGVCDYGCQAVASGPAFDDIADCDADQDGLYDGLEYDLAKRFEPYLWFSASEEGYRSDRLPHFAVEPLAPNVYSIFYALSYFEDYGDPPTGFTSHPGDSEFIVVDIDALAGNYTLARVFLSAHYRTITSGSGWFAPPEITTTLDASGNEHPVVYVAEWKHANYRSLSSCDAGALWTDHCSEDVLEPVGIIPGRNVGNPLHPLLDSVGLGGAFEYYWSSIRFCGWRIMSIDNAGRGACPGEDSTYGAFMNLWLTSNLQ